MTALADLKRSKGDLIVIAGDGARRMADSFRSTWCPHAVIFFDHHHTHTVAALYEARSMARTLSRPVLFVLDGFAMIAAKKAESIADFFAYAGGYGDTTFGRSLGYAHKDFLCAVQNDTAFSFGVSP